MIRDPVPTDETAWRRLWGDYIAFYQGSVPDVVTSATWQRILDPASPMFARVADLDGILVGFAIAVLHDGTWTLAQSCYLEDLYVAPGLRGAGIGRALIDDLVGSARRLGWARLYWHTRSDNLAARRLYDRFAAADDFVRYRMVFES